MSIYSFPSELCLSYITKIIPCLVNLTIWSSYEWFLFMYSQESFIIFYNSESFISIDYFAFYIVSVTIDTHTFYIAYVYFSESTCNLNNYLKLYFSCYIRLNLSPFCIYAYSNCLALY